MTIFGESMALARDILPNKSQKSRSKNGGARKRPKQTDNGIAMLQRQFQGLSVGLRMEVIPATRRAVQNYCNDCTVSSSVTQNTYGTAVSFLLNSTFAPGGAAATAHQPYLRDTLAAQYGRYRVNAAYWELEFANGTYTAATVESGIITVRLIMPGDSTTIGASTTSVAAEKPLTWSKMIVPNTPAGHAVFTGGGPIHQLLGIPKQQYEANLEDYAALVSASPSRVLSLEVAVAFQSVSMTARGFGRIMYDVEYFQPVPVAQS